MRAAFGLVGILITLGVIVWLLGPGGMLGHEKAVIDAGNKAHVEVSQIAGKDADTGAPAKESVTIQVATRGGKTDSLFVSSVVPGGAYEKYWGLQRKDSILEMGALSVRDQVASKEDADAYLMDAYQKLQPLVVMRDGKKITLPLTTPGTPKPAGDNPLQSQLDQIKNAGH